MRPTASGEMTKPIRENHVTSATPVAGVTPGSRDAARMAAGKSVATPKPDTALAMTKARGVPTTRATPMATATAAMDQRIHRTSPKRSTSPSPVNLPRVMALVSATYVTAIHAPGSARRSVR